MKRHHHTAGAQMDLPGITRQRRTQHRRVRREPAKRVKMALGKPYGAKAVAVGEGCAFKKQSVFIGVEAGLVASEKRQAEHHALVRRLWSGHGGMPVVLVRRRLPAPALPEA